MTVVNLYALTADGRNVPVRADAAGNIAGGGSLGSAQSGQPWNYAAASGGITDTSDVTLAPAQGVGKSAYLTSLQVMNSSATATEVVIKDGSTVIWRAKFGASMIQPVSVPLNLASSPNTALKAACITSGSATYINAQGYVDVSPAGTVAAITPQDELLDEFGNLMFDNNSNNAQLFCLH